MASFHEHAYQYLNTPLFLRERDTSLLQYIQYMASMSKTSNPETPSLSTP